ncbi:MAG: hypothetical protein ACR2ID_02220 [Chthoniobacterales bacterium]
MTTVSAVAAATLLGQEGTSKTGEGMLTVAKKSYALSQALAYEATIDDEDVIAVVLTGQPVSSEKLQEAQEREKEDRTPDFKRPFLKLEFKRSGELKTWSAGAGETIFGRRSGHATGELKLQKGRALGKASEPLETEGMFPSGFAVRFDVGLLKSGESLPSSGAKKGGPAANVAPTVTGVFEGNGKEAKLAYVSARWGEPFDGKPGIVLVFTEKDHSKDKKPDFNAAFGRFGSALVMSLYEDGQIYGCQVVHSAHKKQGFSSIGNLEANSFAYDDGKVEGELTTHGQVDTFGETWKVDLKFVAPLGAIPKELQPAQATKPEKAVAFQSPDEDEPAGEPGAAALNAKDIALTKDATEVEYEALVGHIAFKSPSNVKSVCAELAASLKAQGWTTDGSDMVQPQSSILKRKRGAATLTIFVKPQNEGSEVKLMTEGLSWQRQ